MHIELLRATGRTAQSCTRFSDLNVCVTSRSMWERPFRPSPICPFTITAPSITKTTTQRLNTKSTLSPSPTYGFIKKNTRLFTSKHWCKNVKYVCKRDPRWNFPQHAHNMISGSEILVLFWVCNNYDYQQNTTSLHSTFYTLKKNWRQQLTYQDREKKEELNKNTKKRKDHQELKDTEKTGQKKSFRGNKWACIPWGTKCMWRACIYGSETYVLPGNVHVCVWACMPRRVWGDVSICVHIWVYSIRHSGRFW